MDRHGENSLSLPTNASDLLAGQKTDDLARNEWWARFFRYFDEQVEAGKILRRWQNAGCALPHVADQMYCFVTDNDHLARGRRDRGKKGTRVLRAAIKSLEDLAAFYNTERMPEDAERVSREVQLTKERLGTVKLAFNSKRLGVARQSMFLVQIDAWVSHATGKPPTPTELVHLVKAARFGLNQQSQPWENAELIGKAIRNFKKNNPLLVSLINLRAIASASLARLAAPKQGNEISR